MGTSLLRAPNWQHEHMNFHCVIQGMQVDKLDGWTVISGVILVLLSWSIFLLFVLLFLNFNCCKEH